MGLKNFDFECGCGVVLSDQFVETDEQVMCPECGDAMMKLPTATKTYRIEGDNGASVKPRKRKNP